MKGGAATKGVAVSIGLPKWSLVDIGINLTSEMYLGNYHHGEGKYEHAPDVDLVVGRAAKVGVTGLLITGGNLEESKAAIQLAHKYHLGRCNAWLRLAAILRDALSLKAMRGGTSRPLTH